MIFRECEYCQAALDPGERCTCRDEAEKEKREDKAKQQAAVISMLLHRYEKKKP